MPRGRGGMADAPGLGPGGPLGPWRFESSRPHFSPLRTDEPVEQRDRVAMSDRDVLEARLGPTDADQIAVLAEDPPDVSRVVGKEVADVAVFAHPAAGQPGPEPIDRPAAAGVDEPPKQRCRAVMGQFALPIHQLDAALMLSTPRHSLRKGGGPDRMARQ